jgi:hypothetical protein
MTRLIVVAAALALSACKPGATPTVAPTPPPSPREPEIRKFINTYFESWSARDMATYGRTFHSRARVWFTDEGPMEKEPFLESQRKAHASSTYPMKEVPLTTEITVKGDLAHVIVYWELDRGTERVRGYDFFTLVFVESRWQIIALVFNQEP